MIDGIRSARLPVPSLDQAAAWYGRFLEAPPYLAGADAVTFYLNGFLLTLRQGAPQADGAVVYWAVDDLAAELERLAGLGAQPHEAVAQLDAMTRHAAVRDPFGNVLGLVERNDPAERRARSQRSAERIALREIRTVLDGMGEGDQEARRLRRKLWIAVGAGVVAGGLLLWLVLPERPARDASLLERQPPALRKP